MMQLTATEKRISKYTSQKETSHKRTIPHHPTLCNRSKLTCPNWSTDSQIVLYFSFSTINRVEQKINKMNMIMSKTHLHTTVCLSFFRHFEYKLKI